MVIKQLSVLVQNESGRLLNVTDILKQSDINISALSIAETEEYGILRMIVSDPEEAAQALRAEDYTVRISDVILLITPDVPGSLNENLLSLAREGINVSYMYGYSSDGMARLILKTSDAKRASEILSTS